MEDDGRRRSGDGVEVEGGGSMAEGGEADLPPSLELELEMEADLPPSLELELELEASLWSNVPTDTLERVLAFLPLRDLFRYKAVCTSWARLPSNHKFLAFRAQVFSPPKEFALACHPFPAHPRRVRYPFPLVRDPILPGRRVIICNNSKHYQLPFVPDQYTPVSGAGRFLCCIKISFSGVDLCVCNPVTERAEFLPPLPQPSSHTVSAIDMVMDDFTSSDYRIVLMDKASNWALTYDSRSKQWRRTGYLVLHASSLCFPEYSQGVYWRGSLYRLAVTPGPYESARHLRSAIMVYDFQQRHWSKIHLDTSVILMVGLTENRGRVCALGIKGWRSKEKEDQSVHVMELYLESSSFGTVHTLPPALSKLVTDNMSSLRVAGHDDSICLSLMSSGKVVLYDMVERSWKWVELSEPAALRFPLCTLSPELDYVTQ